MECLRKLCCCVCISPPHDETTTQNGLLTKTEGTEADELNRKAVPNLYVITDIDRAKSKILEATVNYTPRTNSELEVRAGDKIQVEESDSNWCKAQNLTTTKYGYVTTNFIAQNLQKTQPWYFGDISFYQARALMEGKQTGTFLVYERPYDLKIPFALLIRCKNQTKNYGIYEEDNTFHISLGFYTNSLETLIEAYKLDEDLSLGLCTALLQPCPKIQVPEFEEQWEINRSDIKILGNSLGKGMSSEVFKGKWKKNDVAVKSLTGSFSKEDFQKEILMLKKLKHTNIVRFYGISTEQVPYYIILEYMEFGDLQTYLKTHDLEEYQRIHVASQVADGMAYLAEEGVIHRDLAARNVLLHEALTAKISDFGLSRLTNSNDCVYQAVTTRRLPIRWLAPECSGENSKEFSQYSDVWAFSILLMEIYTRDTPYKDFKGETQEFLKMVRQGYRMCRPDNMPEEVFDLCVKCWNALPNLRPTFLQISKFFQEYIIGKAKIL